MRVSAPPFNGLQRAGWVMVLLACLAGCADTDAGRDTPEAASPSGEPAVSGADLERGFLLTGELEAVRSDDVVVPRNPSWRTQIRWIEKDGARVVEGQKVVELDNSMLVSDLEDKELAELRALNSLDQKRAELEAQEADQAFQLEKERVALEKAKIEADIPEEIRPRREHQEKQLALERARAAYEKALNAYESFRRKAEADLAVLQIALNKARREVEIGRRALETMVLRAPRDGIVVISENREEGRKFQVGDTTWVGNTVARIPDLTGMRVVAALSDVDDGRIEVGDRAVCFMDAYPELRFPGLVSEITPVAQEASWRSLRRAFRVKVDLDETDPERMRPGMSVRVEVDRSRAEG